MTGNYHHPRLSAYRVCRPIDDDGLHGVQCSLISVYVSPIERGLMVGGVRSRFYRICSKGVSYEGRVVKLVPRCTDDC
jgi:hypothetical protein